jgi:hypothetical protein
MRTEYKCTCDRCKTVIESCNDAEARDLVETHKAFQERMESSDEGNYMTLEGKLTPDEVGQRIRAMREQLLAEMAASEHHACLRFWEIKDHKEYEKITMIKYVIVVLILCAVTFGIFFGTLIKEQVF